MLGAFFVIVVILIIFGLVVQMSKSAYKGAKNVSKEISNNMKDVDLETTVFSTIAKADNYIHEKKENYNRIKKETLNQYKLKQQLDLGEKRMRTRKGMNILIKKTQNQILSELKYINPNILIDISGEDLEALTYICLNGLSVKDAVRMYVSENKPSTSKNNSTQINDDISKFEW